MKEDKMTQQGENNKRNQSLPAALGLIIVGIIFLLRNFRILQLGYRWWALFFLIPILYLLMDVIRRRRDNDGNFPSQARGSLIGLISLSTIMVIFLLGVNWGIIWPVFIIIGGLSVILAGWR